MPRLRSRVLFGIALAAALPLKAYAVLGGDVSTVSRTKSSISGAVFKASKTSRENDSVNEIEADGLLVREYASTEGKIFAVTWRGIAEPDLEVLLGKYFPEYKSNDALQAPTRARHKNVATSEIVVRRFGHMRDKHGLAFVPKLVPAGVNVGDLE